MRFEDLPPFLRVEQAQELTQLGRSQLYEQTRLWRGSGGKEGIPVVRFGRCLRSPGHRLGTALANAATDLAQRKLLRLRVQVL